MQLLPSFAFDCSTFAFDLRNAKAKDATFARSLTKAREAKDATFARSLTTFARSLTKAREATFAFDYATFAFDYPLLLTSQPQRQKATQRQKAKAKGEAKGAHFFFAPLLVTTLCF